MLLLIGVAAAVVAAMAFGTAAVVEQRSTHRVKERGALDPRLLRDLARQLPWLAAIGVTVAGLALQMTALRLAPLALVQPILVCDLLFAVLIRALVVRRRMPDRLVLGGVACSACGLAAFLAVARPHGGTSTVSPVAVVPLAAGLAAVLGICLMVARLGSREMRPLAIALACGVVYGVTAFLLKEVTLTFSQGFTAPATQWPFYALVILGPLGFLLNQSAFQAGILIAPVLSIITVTDPLVSIGIARLWLNEQIASGPADVVGEVLALAVMSVGVIALAHRAPHGSRRSRHEPPSPGPA